MIRTKLAHYEITSHLGSGGMGDVYQATDSKLGRSVAIKLLPEAFSHDSERVARFEREARVLASLNHPHIAAIHGLEESGDRRFLVMELVEGETLAERIKREPIPVDESIQIAKQICEALEAAHEKGIIHRDLKPANVKITPDGKVKVLDFGLAKAFESETSKSNLSQSPTLSMAATNAGVILGTAAYMSPEQAKGRTVDRRTDIFSFGCLLYEMLTGQPPFTGDSIAEIIGALQYKEPDWSRLPDATPAYVRGILRRCLQKDKTKRLASAGDIAIQIQDAGSYSDLFATQTGISAPPLAGNAFRWRGKLAFCAAVLAALFIGSVAAWFLKPTASSPPPLQLAVPLPLGDQLVGQGSSSALGSPSIVLSPDGKLLVYGAIRDGTQMLYLRPLDSNEAKPIPGTDGGYEPFFAPDGKGIGFFAQGKLKTTTLTGASAQTLCDAPGPAGGSWGPDETIVFAPFYSSGLWQVSANGGEPKEIAAIDRSVGEQAYVWPHYLPGGRQILFGVFTGSGWDLAHLSIFTLATGERRPLLQGASHGWFVPPDNLGYVHGGTLMKVPVDPRNWKVSSASPVSIAEDVMYSAFPGGFNFAFSESGALAYVAAPGQFRRRLVWKDRKGNVDPIPGSVGALWAAVLSPDGKKAALTVEGNIRDVWVYDLDRGTMIRITTESGGSMWPKWSHDGKHIVYRGNRSGYRNLFWRLADGTGGEEQLTTGEFMQTPGGFSPNGKVFIFQETTPATASDLWLAFPQGADVGEKAGTSSKPRVFQNTRFSESAAAFSPDGRWIAYVSNESGRDEVYVVPFPGPGGRLPVSTGGGANPRWSQNGREIIYLNDNQLMAVAVTTDPTFRASRPTALFSAFGLGPVTPFDVSADGQRFLMTEAAIPEQPPTHINLVVNWLEGLKQRVPVP